MHVQRILRENQRVAVALVLKKVNEEVENQNWIAPPVFAEKKTAFGRDFYPAISRPMAKNNYHIFFTNCQDFFL